MFVSLLKCCENSSPLFMINRVQLDSEITGIDFAMLPAQLLLVGSSFICRCHILVDRYNAYFNELCHWSFGRTINFIKFPVLLSYTILFEKCSM